MEKGLLDYNSILEKCGIGNLPANLVIKNIANLEEFYDSSELVSIYNYILLNVEDADVLLQFIKFLLIIA